MSTSTKVIALVVVLSAAGVSYPLKWPLHMAGFPEEVGEKVIDAEGGKIDCNLEGKITLDKTGLVINGDIAVPQFNAALPLPGPVPIPLNAFGEELASLALAAEHGEIDISVDAEITDQAST